MSQTKLERRNSLKLVGLFFEKSVEMPDGLLDKNIERSRDEVFRMFLNIDEHFFRGFVTLADGAEMPTDFLRDTGNVYMNVSGTDIPATYFPPQDIGHIQTNILAKASVNNPYYSVIGLKLVMFPAGTSNVIFEYYQSPPRMFGDDVPDDTQDTMPPDAEPLIIRGAYARCLQMLADEGAALKLTKEALAEQIASNESTFKMLAANLMQNARQL